MWGEGCAAEPGAHGADRNEEKLVLSVMGDGGTRADFSDFILFHEKNEKGMYFPYTPPPINRVKRRKMTSK